MTENYVKQTIAIVEDDAQQRSYYAEALRVHDYDVKEYEDRQQAQDAFEIELPDLAILDIALKSDVGGGYVPAGSNGGGLRGRCHPNQRLRRGHLCRLDGPRV